MELQKTWGITLSSRLVGEADILAEIFTLDYGKRLFSFKGLKKSKSRPRIISDPGILSSLNYYFNENKRYTIINDFTVTHENKDIRDNYEKILNLHYIVELIKNTTGENEPHHFLYKMLKSAIETLNNSENPYLLSLVFTLHIIRYHGIMPDFERCNLCGTTESPFYTINFKEKVIACSHCSGKYDYHCKMSPGMVGFILYAPGNKFNNIEGNYGQYINEDEITTLLFNLSLFIEDYFHIVLKSKGLLFQKT